MRNPKECSRFETCSAPLCPMDHDLKKQLWYIEEPVCRKFHTRWINKQRSIQKRQTASYRDRPIGILDLIRASRPRQLSEEQRKAIAGRLNNARVERKEAISMERFEGMGGEPNV